MEERRGASVRERLEGYGEEGGQEGTTHTSCQGAGVRRRRAARLDGDEARRVLRGEEAGSSEVHVADEVGCEVAGVGREVGAETRGAA